MVECSTMCELSYIQTIANAIQGVKKETYYNLHFYTNYAYAITPMVECSTMCELSYIQTIAKVNLTAFIYRTISFRFLFTHPNKPQQQTQLGKGELAALVWRSGSNLYDTVF